MQISILTGLVWIMILPFSFALEGETASKDNSAGSAVKKEISRTMDVEKKIQKREADWVEESKELSETIIRLAHEKKQLEDSLAKLNRLKSLKEEKLKESRRKQVEAARVKQELDTFLSSVLEALEIHVSMDLPFLPGERSVRLDSLKDMMVDPEISFPEKFRRIFEALQIETEYGTTCEVNRRTIEFDGKSVLTDVFWLGRVSLFCQTIDGKKSGCFDIGTGTWKVLPEHVNQDMAKAVAMVKKERTVELVELPLGRIISHEK